MTDVLALLPTPADPFVLGPRDHLTQILQLLSTLRNGDHRFLPLLLAKVHDVLPRLASPIVQTLPEGALTGDICALDPSIDIFDGFGNAGMGVASSLPYNKPIENVCSERSQSNDGSSFSSPPVIQSPMEYPGMSHYNAFPDLKYMPTQPQVPQLHRSTTMPTSQPQTTNGYGMLQRSLPEYQPFPKTEVDMNDYGFGYR